MTLRHFTVRKWFPHRERSLPEVLKRAFCPAFSHPFHTAVSTKTTICTVSRFRHQPKSGTEINNINLVEISNIYPPRSPSSTESTKISLSSANFAGQASANLTGQNFSNSEKRGVQPFWPDSSLKFSQISGNGLQPFWPDSSPNSGSGNRKKIQKMQRKRCKKCKRNGKKTDRTGLRQMQKMQREDEFFDAP